MDVEPQGRERGPERDGPSHRWACVYKPACFSQIRAREMEFLYLLALEELSDGWTQTETTSPAALTG